MADQDKLLDHNYDGIQEYDNDLPRWWVWLFWITVIWGIIYVFYFHAPSTPTPHEKLAADLKEIDAQRAKHAPAPSAGGDESTMLLALAKSTDAVTKGGAVFTAKCAPCHGAAGQGVIGPNLTDNFWIHGGAITDIKRTVVEGVPAKGMIAWKALLTADEMNNVVAYVWTLNGTNPPNPKAAEGQEVMR